jgi:hypothetical protein
MSFISTTSQPCRISGGVPDGVLNVPVAEIILNEPRIGSLVGQGKAAGMAQHVGVGREGQGGCFAARIQNQIDGRAVQRLPLLTLDQNVLGWDTSLTFKKGAKNRWL